MEAIEAICTRRSVRKYTNQPVSEELVTELLQAAMYAPSAGNEQPWHFVVIRDRQILHAIPEFHPYASMVRRVSVAILVCGDPGLEKYGGRWMLDCAAATQNILLAAHARGLATVWVGIYPETDRIAGIRRLLDLPETIAPLSLIPIGYPAEQVPQPNRFNASRVHYDKW
jgi:nitroreductase